MAQATTDFPCRALLVGGPHPETTTTYVRQRVFVYTTLSLLQPALGGALLRSTSTPRPLPYGPKATPTQCPIDVSDGEFCGVDTGEDVGEDVCDLLYAKLVMLRLLAASVLGVNASCSRLV